MFRKSVLLSLVFAAPLLLASCGLTAISIDGLRPVYVKGLAATENCPELHIIRQEKNRSQAVPYIIKERNDPGSFAMVSSNNELTFDVTCVRDGTVMGRSVLTFKVTADRPGRPPTPVNVRIASPELSEGTPSRAGYTVTEGQYPPVITVTFPD